MSQFYALHLYLDAASKITLPYILAIVWAIAISIIHWILDRKNKPYPIIPFMPIIMVFGIILIIGVPQVVSNDIVKPMTAKINGSSVVLLNKVDSIADKKHPIINNTMIVYSAENSNLSVKSKYDDEFNGQSAKFTITKNEIIPENKYAEFMLRSETELAKLNLTIDESSIKQTSNYEINAMTEDGENIIISPTSHIKNEHNTIYINVTE